jgi:hypothetical protein
MDTSLARLDLTEIFCDVDDFYQVLERIGELTPQLPYDGEAKPYRSRLSISEAYIPQVMKSDNSGKLEAPIIG